MGKWKPVEQGIHSLRFGDEVDISYIETGDWRAEFLRDHEAVLTVYPPKTLALCTLVPDEGVSVPVEIAETICVVLRFSRRGDGEENFMNPRIDTALAWLSQRQKGGSDGEK